MALGDIIKQVAQNAAIDEHDGNLNTADYVTPLQFMDPIAGGDTFYVMTHGVVPTGWYRTRFGFAATRFASSTGWNLSLFHRDGRYNTVGAPQRGNSKSQSSVGAGSSVWIVQNDWTAPLYIRNTDADDATVFLHGNGQDATPRFYAIWVEYMVTSPRPAARMMV